MRGDVGGGEDLDRALALAVGMSDLGQGTERAAAIGQPARTAARAGAGKTLGLPSRPTTAGRLTAPGSAVPQLCGRVTRVRGPEDVLESQFQRLVQLVEHSLVLLSRAR